MPSTAAGIEAREPAGEWCTHSPEDNDRRGEGVHLHTLLAQCCEEARPELETDGKDKQDQP
jgi:hypothetical protein